MATANNTLHTRRRKRLATEGSAICFAVKIVCAGERTAGSCLP